MSKKYRRIKKTLAMTLALVMVLGILPLGMVASADDNDLGSPSHDAHVYVTGGTRAPALVLQAGGADVTVSLIRNSDENPVVVAIAESTPTGVIDLFGNNDDEPFGSGDATEASFVIRPLVPGSATISITQIEDTIGNVVAANLSMDVTVVPQQFDLTGATIAQKIFDGTNEAVVTQITFAGHSPLSVSDGEATISTGTGGHTAFVFTVTNYGFFNPNNGNPVTAAGQSGDVYVEVSVKSGPATLLTEYVYKDENPPIAKLNVTPSNADIPNKMWNNSDVATISTIELNGVEFDVVAGKVQYHLGPPNNKTPGTIETFNINLTPDTYDDKDELNTDTTFSVAVVAAGTSSNYNITGSPVPTTSKIIETDKIFIAGPHLGIIRNGVNGVNELGGGPNVAGRCIATGGNVIGILRWYPTELDAKNDTNEITVGNHGYLSHSTIAKPLWWHFEPYTDAFPKYEPSIIGETSAIVFGGTRLDPVALDIPGVTPGPLNATFTGGSHGTVNAARQPRITFPDSYNAADINAAYTREHLRAIERATWQFTVSYSGTKLDGSAWKSPMTSETPVGPTEAGSYTMTIVGWTTTGTAGAPLNDAEFIIYHTIPINIAPLRLQWNPGMVLDKVYDGNRNAEIIPQLVFGNIRLNYADIWLEGETVQFASADVGTHPIINVQGFHGAELQGPHAHNYILPSGTPAFTTATIKPRDIIIIPKPDSFKYYGDKMKEDISFTVLTDNNAAITTPLEHWQFYHGPEELTSTTDFYSWIAREGGDAVGKYPYKLNKDAISPNFNVSFPTGMTHTYEIKPAPIQSLAGGWKGGDSKYATMTAYEAYAAWLSAVTPPSASNAQALVDLAISLGRLPSSVNVITGNDLTGDDKIGAQVPSSRWTPWIPTGATYSGLPMDWTTRAGLTQAGVKGGLSYSITGALNLSGTQNVTNTIPVGVYPTHADANLYVSPVTLNTTSTNIIIGSTTIAPYKQTHPTIFGDAQVMLAPGVTAADANNENLSHLLPKSGTLTFNNPHGTDAQVRYEVEWRVGGSQQPLNMTAHGNEREFTGTISFPDAVAGLIPWFTEPGNRIVTRTIKAVEVFTPEISYNVPDVQYTGKAWEPGVPVVTLNGLPVADQPTSFNWLFTGDGSGPVTSTPGYGLDANGGVGWGTRTTPPTNAGNYKVQVSTEAYGNYTRASTGNIDFTIKQREIKLQAKSIEVYQGRYQGGGLPNTTYEVIGIAEGESLANAIEPNRDPTLRINGFNGNVLGTYDLVFTSRAITGRNYKLGAEDYIDGTVTVVPQPADTFRVSVVGGTLPGGGTFGDYPAGTVLTITADSDPSGREFTRWTSTPSVSFGSASAKQTTFTMPAREVAISATFDRLPTTPTIPKEPIFPDLTSGPAFNAVQWAATMRIIEGRDGLFHPKEQISRAQFAVILHRYAGRPNVSSTVSFTDVTPGTTIGRAVAWAVDKGITSGRSSTVFGINDIISRELMMVMLYNYHTKVDNGSGGASANALARFTDRGDVSAGALNAMRWAVENGLLTGQGGKILPKASMTRDQLVTILYRYDKVFN